MTRTFHRTLRLVGLACCLALLPQPTTGAAAAIPPLMRTLLQVFPERHGWFVEGPLGAAPETPEKARPLFERPRVIVPDVDALEGAVGRLFTASGILPIRKIERHDQKPGIKGLPGFRGIWCRTENKDDIGFAILTPNQNRFLIWARYQYFPSLATDSIPRKIRDWYARSVSEYLASVDFGVPDSPPPRAGARNLPDWMDIYPDLPAPQIKNEQKLNDFFSINAEIHTWGWEGMTAFVPTAATIDRLINEAPDTLYSCRLPAAIQSQYRDYFASGGTTGAVNTLTPAGFDTLSSGSYFFAVDRYGRIRIAADTLRLTHAMLFPDESISGAGVLKVQRVNSHNTITDLSVNAESYFFPLRSPSLRDDVGERSDRYLLSLGHLLASLRALGIELKGPLIHKF